jgi:hypothetical protein
MVDTTCLWLHPEHRQRIANWRKMLKDHVDFVDIAWETVQGVPWCLLRHKDGRFRLVRNYTTMCQFTLDRSNYYVDLDHRNLRIESWTWEDMDDGTRRYHRGPIQVFPLNDQVMDALAQSSWVTSFATQVV